MKKFNLLIVDDEPEMLESYRKIFLKKDEYNITLISNYEGAKEELKRKEYSVLLADLKLGGDSGIELCKYALKCDPNIKAIIISGYGTIESSVEAIKAGAMDFLEKPFSSRLLFGKIESLLRNAEPKSVEKRVDKFFDIIYKSRKMAEVIEAIRKVAPTDVSVLIQGESGSGKELLARALHKLSKRKAESFVPVNCAVFPENLFESELFGHERGAFTGALSTKPGILEFANKGTFFFDEITETPLNVQAKLLRMIEEKKIRRLGGHKEIQLDIRIISATNRNPEKAIKNNLLREDLFYRLSSFTIVIPPLRERREDILPLFYYYLNQICDKNGHKRKKLSENAENILLKYDWPGNVREIINLTNQLFFLCSRENIYEEDLPLPNTNKGNYLFKEIRDLNYKDAKEKILESFEIDYLKHNLSRFDGNISKTAEHCGMDRKTIHRLINKYGIIFK